MVKPSPSNIIVLLSTEAYILFAVKANRAKFTLTTYSTKNILELYNLVKFSSLKALRIK